MSQITSSRRGGAAPASTGRRPTRGAAGGKSSKDEAVGRGVRKLLRRGR